MKPALQVTELLYRYRAGFSLGPVDLDLGPGLVHLRGPNGSGKTTLLRCLCGALHPTGGRIRLCGGDPVRDPATRRLVAFLPAEPDLPDFLRVDEAWQTLATLRGAHGWSGAGLCESLELPPDLVLAHGSAGQRRKAELVAVLAGDPPVLLLDELFNHLDRDAVRIVTSWLSDWRRDRLVLAAGHVPLDADATLDVRPGRPLALRHGA